VPLSEANGAAKNRTVAGCDPILADRFPAKIPAGFGGRTRPRFLCRAHIFSWQSAIQPASRLEGKPAGKGAASSYDLRYGGQLTCL